MKRRGVKESDAYDWEKVDPTGNSTTAATITCSQSNQINQAQVKMNMSMLRRRNDVETAQVASAELLHVKDK
ncbi:Tau-tubulin kinase homolog Asator, partial [Eumeta japonica]